MSAKAARRLLVLAFAISLFVHVVLVLTVNLRAPTYNPGETVTTTPRRLHMLLTIVHAQPTLPPKPLATPHVIALHPAVMHVTVPVLSHAVAASAQPAVAVAKGKGPATTASSGNLTPSPRPCNAPAAISASPDPPEIEPDVRAQMTAGISRILVQLDATGNILATSVAASSGNPSLDQVAIAMARSASYLPARAQCKPTSGNYTFSARFAPW